MQVLGALVKLPKNSDLPLPWWHRATLGLETGTWCYVALVQTSRRPVAELNVSVLDPDKWNQMLSVKCVAPDEPGCVLKATRGLADFNIELAEGVTVSAGERHEVTFFCHPVSSMADPRARLEEHLKKQGFSIVQIEGYEKPTILTLDRGVVESGWIRNVNWRSGFNERYKGAKDVESIDCSKAVISADTTSRVLRFVFPRRDARRIRVDHRNEPGVMRQILDVFHRHQLNILSLLLRHGGAKPKHAVLVAVCEPTGGLPPKDLYSELMRELHHHLDPGLMVRAQESDGIESVRTITPRRANTVVAHIPLPLIEALREVKSLNPNDRRTVFLSRRFNRGRRAELVAAEIRAAIADSGFMLLELPGEADIDCGRILFSMVSAKMWAADTAIVLIAGDSNEEAVGMNLAHEYGFFQGQGKPVVLLVDSEVKDPDKLWSNIQGVYTQRISAKDPAFDRNDVGSAYRISATWLKHVQRGRAPDGVLDV